MIFKLILISFFSGCCCFYFILFYFDIFCFLCRRLFPGHEYLADELLQRANVNPTLRPHQLQFPEFDLITQEFIAMCTQYKQSCTPLQVNKPELIKQA